MYLNVINHVSIPMSYDYTHGEFNTHAFLIFMWSVLWMQLKHDTLLIKNYLSYKQPGGLEWTKGMELADHI